MVSSVSKPVIWNKLKQGNGRGTCCWSINNFKLNLEVFLFK